jgi:hypothetical protein
MYIDKVDVLITIETSTTISSSAFMKNGVAGAIITPAALTGTALSFQVSYDDTVYTALYGTDGNAISYTVAASRVIPLNKEIFAAFPYLKLVSGTAEDANRTFTILIRAG